MTFSSVVITGGALMYGTIIRTKRPWDERRWMVIGRRENGSWLTLWLGEYIADSAYEGWLSTWPEKTLVEGFDVWR